MGIATMLPMNAMMVPLAPGLPSTPPPHAPEHPHSPSPPPAQPPGFPSTLPLHTPEHPHSASPPPAQPRGLPSTSPPHAPEHPHSPSPPPVTLLLSLHSSNTRLLSVRRSCSAFSATPVPAPRRCGPTSHAFESGAVSSSALLLIAISRPLSTRPTSHGLYE